MKRISPARGLLWSALLVTATVGCGPAPVALEYLPLPPFAVEGNYNGGFETRVDQRLSNVRDQLGPRYGPLDVGDFALMEKGKGWNDIEVFYSQPAVQKVLTDAGFVRQAKSPDTSIRHQIMVWTRKRTFGKDELLAALYVPGNPDDPLNFMLRLHAPLQKR